MKYWSTPEAKEKRRLNQQRYRKNNPEKVKLRNKNWRNKNSEKSKSYTDKYRATPKGKANIKRFTVKRRGAMVSTLTEQEWQWLLEEWDYACAYCGTKFDEETPSIREHVIPIIRGGSNSFLNIVPSCSDCNQRKGVKDATPGHPIEF